ncbi:MAG TPA: SRPBCC domain-containing protein [Bacilli bacterium]|nr:SRPBCC domain-containing protein [Bacilli bacterium]
MNQSYQCRVQFQSPPSVVYQALTTPEGLRGWWTTDCEVNPEIGGVHRFYFEKVLFNGMRVTELVPDRVVHWTCVEGWSEWLDTEVLFTLTETADGGTELLFEHRGLQPVLKCYKMCSQGWDNFIKGSLQAYVDTGKGHPHVPKFGLMGKLAGTAFKVFSRRY